MMCSDPTRDMFAEMVPIDRVEPGDDVYLSYGWETVVGVNLTSQRIYFEGAPEETYIEWSHAVPSLLCKRNLKGLLG